MRFPILQESVRIPPLIPSKMWQNTLYYTQDNCEVTYQVGVYILGTEGSIMVVFDETQSDINDWSGKK